jgi:hypothetical protein
MPSKTKATANAGKLLQQHFLQGNNQIKSSQLQSFGYDTSQQKHIVGNIRVSKDLLFNAFNLSIIDDQKDLDGNNICDNIKLVNRVISHWETGETEIHFDEFIALNIYPAASEIKIGNIKLTNYLGLDKTYDINLLNSEKNIQDKWIDSTVTTNRVIEVLRKFQSSKTHHDMSEVQFNKVLEVYCKGYFETVKKSDTTNFGMLDLTIGSIKNKVAIELKLSKHLTNPKRSQECRGQIEDYKMQFRSNLILVIAGKREDFDHPNLKAVLTKAKQIEIKYCPIYWE